MEPRKDLRDMTLDELWELFPITLVAHRNEWDRWAQEEIGFLYELLSDYQPTLSHIGSTAIPTICAKPIIDILVELPSKVGWQTIQTKMERSGYICMNRTADRMSFNKGYTPDGYAERVFHIHFHAAGDNDEIYFRDYLIKHPDIAKEYEALKQSLILKYGNNRDAYTDAKSDFVAKIISTSRTPRR